MHYRTEDQASTDNLLSADARPCRVLIAVPFFKNEHLVAAMIGALVRCRADLAAVDAEVVFYNDSPDYAPLGTALRDNLAAAQAAFPCRIETNPHNLGFVRTMNQAVAEAVRRRADLLLLNSDTVIEPGAVPEMVRVAGLDHMIGFVNPRSNNATIATLPLHRAPATSQALASYQALAAKLPAVSYAPTAVGFCMLIRWNVLAEFGGFDEIYGHGYNEENDLVMRASRCGFRAVLANHAFVWHEGEESFASAEIARDVWEPTNRAILDSRYPEYGAHTAAHYHAPGTVAEQLLAALLPDAEGKIDIAFDFSSFRAAHNGTFQAGLQLLQVAGRVWGEQANIFVLCDRDVYAFHGYAALGIPRVDPHAGHCFAAIFRVGQPYDWNVLQRLVVSAPVLGIYMLDTISIDCPQLSSPLLYNIWQFTLDHADVIATQSSQTQHQFGNRFLLPDHAVNVMSLHSLDVEEYRLPGLENARPRDETAAPRLLVLGNHFHHKYLSQTANALAAAFPKRQIVALGAPKPGKGGHDPMAIPPLAPLANLTGVVAGDLSDAEIASQYSACDAVIFPSHAEGFGFPALNALAARRPVFVRRLPVFEELWAAQGHTPNMHFFDTTNELIELLQKVPVWMEHAAPPPGNGAKRSLIEIKSALEQAMRQADYQRIAQRIRAMQLISDLSQTGAQPAVIDNAAAQAARFLAVRVENVTRRLLMWPLLYRAARLMFRITRKLSTLVRRQSA